MLTLVPVLLSMLAAGQQTGLVGEKLEEALEAFQRAVEASPKSVSANNAAGVVLDLLDRSTEARKYFSQAIKAAPTPLEKAAAQRALAVSFGFTRNCRGAE